MFCESLLVNIASFVYFKGAWYIGVPEPIQKILKTNAKIPRIFYPYAEKVC